MTAPDELRIGYMPYTRDLSGPSDTRRFLHFARARNLTWEVAREGARYDVVFLGSLADITRWSRVPPGETKIVYDLSDSYLDIDPGELRARLRGPAKFALRQHEHLEWSYHDSIERICRRADAVLCSTPEQRDRLRAFNGNVHPILDFHTGAAIRVKSDFAVGDTLRIVWEGQGANVVTLAPAAAALRRVAARRKLELHVVTDLRFKPFNGPVPSVGTRRSLDAVVPGVRSFLVEWNAFGLGAVATSADLAIIPMIRTPPVYWAKPENKLLLFWRMGVPTITSPTPAYVRAMRGAGLDLTCEDDAAWERAIDRLAGDEAARREASARGRAHAETEHGEAALLARWDAVLASISGGR